MLRTVTSAGVGLVVTLVAASAPAADATTAPTPDPLVWGACEEETAEGYECATLTVPLDYGDPAGATIDLALIRYPAEPTVREGAILLNPGGPGASGYEFAEVDGQVLDSEMGLGGRFDIIGFDPRGVDRSGGIDCVDDAFIESYIYADDTPDDASELLAVTAQQAKFGEACREIYGDTLRLYSTENTARDMDMIRAALGDEQLTYLGISYGTYLGAVYATLFPDRVRAMVLDAAYEPTGDTATEQWVTQAVGFEEAFNNWAAWCAGSGDCAFTDADVGARWDALIAALEEDPVKSDGGRPVNHVAMFWATISALYTDTRWPMLATALADAEAGDGTALLAMSDRYHGREDDGTFATRRESGPVIRCASGIGRPTPAEPDALLAELHRVAPRMARDYDHSDFHDYCRFFIPDVVEPIVPSYSGSAPIVVVGGLNDPATPFRWAEETVEAMGPSASLVTFAGEGHGQLLSSACVTDIEAAVVRELRLPASGTTCEPDPPVARPAFWDQVPVPEGVGPMVDDAAINTVIDSAIGLTPTQVYADAWHLTGDPGAVLASYQSGFGALGFEVVEAPSTIEGVTSLVALAPDGTQVFVVIIPPSALASNPDLAAVADVAPPGQGFVVVGAFGEM